MLAHPRRHEAAYGLPTILEMAPRWRERPPLLRSASSFAPLEWFGRPVAVQGNIQTPAFHPLEESAPRSGRLPPPRPEMLVTLCEDRSLLPFLIGCGRD